MMMQRACQIGRHDELPLTANLHASHPLQPDVRLSHHARRSCPCNMMSCQLKDGLNRPHKAVCCHWVRNSPDPAPSTCHILGVHPEDNKTSTSRPRYNVAHGEVTSSKRSALLNPCDELQARVWVGDMLVCAAAHHIEANWGAASHAHPLPAKCAQRSLMAM
jgi:hypothetical protein